MTVCSDESLPRLLPSLDPVEIDLIELDRFRLRKRLGFQEESFRSVDLGRRDIIVIHRAPDCRRRSDWIFPEFGLNFLERGLEIEIPRWIDECRPACRGMLQDLQDPFQHARMHLLPVPGLGGILIPQPLEIRLQEIIMIHSGLDRDERCMTLMLDVIRRELERSPTIS